MNHPPATATSETRFAELDWQGRPAAIEYRWIGAEASLQPVVVFLHEGLGSISMWRDFPSAFCNAHGLRGLVFWRAGYGRSTPKLPDEHWRPDFMHLQAHDFLPRFLTLMGVARPWLFGHSDGGSIALLHATRYDVAGVVAVAPHLFVEDVSIASIEIARDAYTASDLKQRLARHHDDPESAFRGWNDAWLSPAFRHWNIEAEVAAIRCPVLAVQGEDDEYGSLEQIRAIARRAPQTELLVIPQCGHSPHRDQPGMLSREAGRFILESTTA